MGRLLMVICLALAAGCGRDDEYLREGQPATLNMGTAEHPVPTRVRIVHDVDPARRPVRVLIMEGEHAASELTFERWAITPTR